MASQAEEKRIAEFIERVRGVEDDAQLRMMALAELSYIHGRKKPDGAKYSDLVNRKLIGAYRGAIKREIGEQSTLLNRENPADPDRPLSGWFHYSDARTKEYQQHQAEGREQKHRNQRPIDPEDFTEAALLALGHAVRMRWSTPTAIAALCALTGRRPYEVAVTGTFEPDPTDRRHLLFSGQAKTRDEARSAETFSIPVLADRELVLEAIAMLRTKIDTGIDNTTFSQRYAKEIGIASKRVFKDAEGGEIKPRDLREAYAAVAFHVFAPRRVSAVQYLNDILGHKTEYLDTTLYYLGFIVE